MGSNKMNNPRPRQVRPSFPPGPLGLAVAVCLALPIGALVWCEAVYLFFGITGEDAPDAVGFLAAVVAFGLAVGWPLFRAHRPAEVLRRACQLGMLVSGLLPVVAVAVLLLWQNASGRPDLGMGGLMLYALPYVALGIAALLAIVFGLGIRLSGRRLQRLPAAEEEPANEENGKAF
ncbi:hypothetical protein [Alkalilimnicola sp. S0819]|uniref:hypothetical protein n=1 Tax=Alkalilimnicola sp. S0819 TaxID=2613922 RepID=UPI0012616670|nr:hypothetical protein [Alkalilimnicola sp. S0819]KAB7622608.1 hypothetical protein F3N43_12110 [Alkalilimnicola sp. S0819]MPQ17378.1 hypothetical protein [Alkalilimnicola sp. S0819]